MPMFTRDEIEQFITEDGTFVYDLGTPFTFRRVDETQGFEVGFDEVLNAGTEVESVFLQFGDRIGRWTAPDGRVVWDRTAHVVAPFGVAWALAEAFEQEAIWDWAIGEARNAVGEIL